MKNKKMLLGAACLLGASVIGGQSTEAAEYPPLGDRAKAYAKVTGDATWPTLGKVTKEVLSEKELDAQCKLLVSRLDLVRDDMKGVKTKADKKDWVGAAAAYVKVLQNRKLPMNAFYNTQGLSDQREGIDLWEPNETDMLWAESALENKFIGQRSYGPLKVPDDLPWTINVTPNKDKEWTWQFNRMYFWHSMGLMYRKYGDERYAKKWVETMRDWVSEADPKINVIWRSIECGARARRWTSSYFNFINSPNLRLEDHVVFMNAYFEHIQFLMPWDRTLKGTRIANIGLIMNDGVLTAVENFPQFKNAEMWKEVAAEIYEDRLDSEVFDDGAQRELTFSYHFGVMNDFRKAKQRLEVLGHEMPEGYWAKVEKMFEYGLYAALPDGQRPMIGHSAQALVTRFMNEGAEFFDRKDMEFVGTRGEEGVEPAYLDTALPKAGYYMMRNKWVDDKSKDALYLLTDLTHSWGGGHSNYDAMNLIMYGYGRVLLDDTGKYTYARPESEKARATKAHNTIVVDGKNQSKASSKLVFFARKGGVSFIDGYQNGYKDMTHRRQVMFVRPDKNNDGYFVVVDRLTGEGEHELEQYWHTFPTKKFALNTTDEFSMWTKNDDGLGEVLIQAVKKDDLDIQLADSFVSYQYNKKTKRPAVKYTKKVKLPATFVTLLKPFKGEKPEIETRLVEGENGMIDVVVKSDNNVIDHVFIGDQPSEIDTEAYSGKMYSGLVRKTVSGHYETVFKDTSEHKKGVKASGWE
ncbi:alginate lyase family protein [Planctomycetota bacterium]|nr:alginate lyase family protein [Planctomycetota bacterium]